MTTVESQETKAGGGASAVPDALWYTRCPVPTASGVAIDVGFIEDEFRADSLSVRSLAASSDPKVRESHFDHNQPNSFRQGGNIPPIWARSRGADLRLVGASWIEQYEAIVALPGSGLSSAEDLRGRRIALPRRTRDQIDFARATTLRAVTNALSYAGIGPDEVVWVDLPVDETFIGDPPNSDRGSLFGTLHSRRYNAAEVIALIRHEVDAIFLSAARGAEEAAFLGAEVVVDTSAVPDRALRINGSTPAVLTVSGRLLEEHPDLVARYLAAGLRGARWAAEHPDETTRIVAREVGASEEAARISYGPQIGARLTPSLDDQLVAAVASQKDFLLHHGFIDQDFDVDGWVARQPLEDARRLVESDR